MLINSKNIVVRFKENLRWATRLDLVSAWATEHKGLSILEEEYNKQALQVRAIIGLWNHLTEPEALRRLNQLGELRLAKDRHFHPKVYLFTRQGRACAWVGSANFTAGGFQNNEEAIFESEDTHSVSAWFDILWNKCGHLEQDTIDSYKDDYEKTRKYARVKPKNGKTKPIELLEGVKDWGSYVNAVRECDIWWSNRSNFSVLGESDSWLHTIDILHDIIAHKNLKTLEDSEKRRVLGLSLDSWALLGKMRQSSMGTVFGINADNIQRILRKVATAENDAFPDLAFISYEEIRKFSGIGQGIATRLLSLARPDRFVSVNGGSLKFLARFAGLKPSTLGKPDNYRKLLEYAYDQSWFQASEPKHGFEASIWRMRIALLDCFVYSHKNKSSNDHSLQQ